MPIYRGSNTKLDYTGIKMTDALLQALQILDAECSYGTFDISKVSPEEGLPKEYRWSATPCDGPYETLYFNGSSWVDCGDLPSDDDEDEDDESCECEHEQCVVCNPASRAENNSSDSKEA